MRSIGKKSDAVYTQGKDNMAHKLYKQLFFLEVLQENPGGILTMKTIGAEIMTRSKQIMFSIQEKQTVMSCSEKFEFWSFSLIKLK